MGDIFWNVVHVACHLLIGKVVYFTQLSGIYDSTATKLQRFKTLISIHHIASAQHHTVIFHYHRLIVFIQKLIGNFLTKVFTTRCAVRCKTYFTYYVVSLWYKFCVRNFPGNTECNQSRRMCVNDCLYVRTGLVDSSMKGILR